jgi:hypothetical protein
MAKPLDLWTINDWCGAEVVSESNYGDAIRAALPRGTADASESLVWEIEPNREVLPATDVPDVTADGWDDPQTLGAFLVTRRLTSGLMAGDMRAPDPQARVAARHTGTHVHGVGPGASHLRHA